MLRLVSARRPVRPSLCSMDATVRGAPIWRHRSRSPTSIPSSRVEVATMTVSCASAKACSERRRSSTDSEEWEAKVSTRLSRSDRVNDSTLRRESANTRRFSPRCSREITSAAFSSDPTQSSRTSDCFPAPPGSITLASPSRPGPRSHRSSSCGLPTVAERPIRCSGRPAMDSRRERTPCRCHPRSSPAKACTSSTTTARRFSNCSRGEVTVETSIASNDSGVVSRMSGGWAWSCLRCPAVVSPWRTSAVRPSHCA